MKKRLYMALASTGRGSERQTEIERQSKAARGRVAEMQREGARQRKAKRGRQRQRGLERRQTRGDNGERLRD